jgi:hypothetical protein
MFYGNMIHTHTHTHTHAAELLPKIVNNEEHIWLSKGSGDEGGGRGRGGGGGEEEKVVYTG